LSNRTRMFVTRLCRAREVTLALIKPTVVASPTAVNQIFSRLESSKDVTILAAKKCQFSREMTEKFYAEHIGRFYFDRLQGYIESGPVIGLALEGEGAIGWWRSTIGNTKVSRVKYDSPGVLRHDFGISDTRNGFHGSDSPDSATRELSIVFPDVSFADSEKQPIDIDGHIVRSSGDESLTLDEPPKHQPDSNVAAKVFREMFIGYKPSSLAQEEFWDKYHTDQNRDWYLNHTHVTKYLEEHTALSTQRGVKLNVLDLGCGTSTVSLMLAYGYSDLHITMIDFSEVACKFQEKVITAMISNALKQNPDSTKSFLEEKNNSIVIKREDARSLSLPDNSVDILLDKGTMDAFSRLNETDCFQAMDEMVRVMDKETGKIIQITEQPPDIRQEMWFRWGRTVKQKIQVKQKKFMDKYIYEVSFQV